MMRGSLAHRPGRSSRRVLPGGYFWLFGATLILPGLGAPTGCSSTAGQGTVVPDGGSGAAGAAGSSWGGGAGASGAAGGVGAGAGAGGSNAAGGQPGSQTCTNAPHVLPLDPSNPQDGITLSGFYVDTDIWNAASYQVSQTMYVCDYNNWYVVANMDNATGDGAVKTYPNVHEDFSAAPALSSFSAISSSFAHAGPHVGIYEFAYDIWLNGVASSGSTEVMIWTDNFNQVPSGSVQETVTFDGQSYQVYKSGSYIAFEETTNVTSGTVNLLELFNHIIAKGWIPSTSTLGAIDYGVELVSTNGMDATFAVNDFSLTTN
jgi:Glycosyl hydrolase family 12